MFLKASPLSSRGAGFVLDLWSTDLLKLIFVKICVLICVHLWRILRQIGSNWFHKLLKWFFLDNCVLVLCFLFVNRGDGEKERFLWPSAFSLQPSVFSRFRGKPEVPAAMNDSGSRLSLCLYFLADI
jgi:hypothetical protein